MTGASDSEQILGDETLTPWQRHVLELVYAYSRPGVRGRRADAGMGRARSVCSTPGCPAITTGGRCADHRSQADRARGTATDRGYTGRGHRAFRRAVLRRDPLCVCTDTSHGHGTPCLKPSTDADHYPASRRDLVAAGLDPDDPARGRGLCAQCHGKATAEHQPGGWHAR